MRVRVRREKKAPFRDGRAPESANPPDSSGAHRASRRVSCLRARKAVWDVPSTPGPDLGQVFRRARLGEQEIL